MIKNKLIIDLSEPAVATLNWGQIWMAFNLDILMDVFTALILGLFNNFGIAKNNTSLICPLIQKLVKLNLSYRVGNLWIGMLFVWSIRLDSFGLS